MPEQFAFDERLRQRRAIHGGERLVLARGLPVDGARHELLAGAGFAAHADGDVAPRHLRHQRENVAHQRRLADDAFDDLARHVARALLLLDDAAQAMVLGASAEDRGQCVARLGIESVDVQQLAIAARGPIPVGRSEDRVELRARERRERSDLVPLAEAVARGETPVRRREIRADERKRANSCLAQQTQPRGRGARRRGGHVDAQLLRQAFRALAIAAAEGIAELHGLGEAADVHRPRAQKLVSPRQLDVAGLTGRAQRR